MVLMGKMKSILGVSIIILTISLSTIIIVVHIPIYSTDFNRLVKTYSKIGLNITTFSLNIYRNIILNKSSSININASGDGCYTIQGKILDEKNNIIKIFYIDSWSNSSIFLEKGKYKVFLEKAYVFYSNKPPSINIYTCGRGERNIHLDLSHYPMFGEYYLKIHRIVDSNINISMMLLGFSWHGKPIYGISIGEKNKPIIVIVAHHHAREIITAYFSLYLLSKIVLEKPDIIHIYRIIIIPTLNPDGYEIVFKNPWIRKNLHPIDDDGDGLFDEDGPEDIDGDGYISEYRNSSGIFYEGIDNDGDGKINEDWPGGVDLNRNYPFMWEKGATLKSSLIYRGEYPFSEPETLAIKYFIEKYRDRIVFLITYHSGANLILYPYGYTDISPPDVDFFKNISKTYAMIANLYVMQSSRLYYSYGELTDWLYSTYNIPAVTVEMYGKAFDYRWMRKHTYRVGKTRIFKNIFEFFNPIDSQIKIILEKNYNALIYMLNRLDLNKYYGRSPIEEIVNYSLH